MEKIIMNIKSEPFGTGSARVIYKGDYQEIPQLPVEEIKELFKSAGMLMFRGFGVGPWLMRSFAEQFSSSFNRDRLRPPVEGSDGFVQMVTEGMGYVEPHSEQANSPFRPDAIWFCCDTPAEQGGETLVWDGIRLWEKLSHQLQQLFRSKRLRFFQCYTPDKWKLFLGEGSSLADVERTLSGVEGVSYYVSPNQSIYLEYVCSAVVKTRFGRQEAFANSLLSERKNTLGDLMTFDDGTPIPEEVISEILDAMQELTQEINWQPGDLAFIDNSRFVHGRNAYTDKRRLIYSSLSFLNF
jgi:hypothetical protein